MNRGVNVFYNRSNLASIRDNLCRQTTKVLLLVPLLMVMRFEFASQYNFTRVLEMSKEDFYKLTPDNVLNAVERAGFTPTGEFSQLNSYENRVFDVRLDN